MWIKLGKNDFIETDDHEKAAHDRVGFGRLYAMKTSALKMWFLAPQELCHALFIAWRRFVRRQEKLALEAKQKSPAERVWLLRRCFIKRLLQTCFEEGARRFIFDAWVHSRTARENREWRFGPMSPGGRRGRANRRPFDSAAWGLPETPRSLRTSSAKTDSGNDLPLLCRVKSVPSGSGDGTQIAPVSQRGTSPMSVRKVQSAVAKRHNTPWCWLRSSLQSRRYRPSGWDAEKPLLDLELRGPGEDTLGSPNDREYTPVDREVIASSADVEEAWMTNSTSLEDAAFTSTRSCNH